jgi:hypothetical protein
VESTDSDEPKLKKGTTAKVISRHKLIDSLSVKQGGDGLVEALVSDKRKTRSYVPKTFDGLMVDFGQSAERKTIWDSIGQSFANMLK